MTKEECREILSQINDNTRCVHCSDIIFYPSTKIKILKNGNVSFISTTHKTLKKIGEHEYSLKVCYDCLINKFSEVKNKNSSKLFNTCGKYVEYAFGVSKEDFILQKKKHAITLGSLIKKYGDSEGKKRWADYCDLQRLTNTFEYKNSKYGMSKDDFKKFNMSRAVTLDNLTLKYGETEGKKRWDDYCIKQAYTNTLEYFISKYGKDIGTQIYSDLNSRKAITLDNYIKRLGVEIGTSKYLDFINSLNSPRTYSKVSQEFFTELDLALSEFNLTTYFYTKSGEFGKILKSTNSYCKIDFYIKEIKLAIEYYGTYWHASPNKYKDSEVVHSNKTAFQIWEKDETRNSNLLCEHGVETIVVWQDEDYKNRKGIINQIYNEVKKRI